MEKEEGNASSIHGTPLAQWTIEEVAQWFATDRGGKWAEYYTGHFEKHDGEDLAELTEIQFIKKLGENEGIRLYNAVSKVKKGGTPDTSNLCPPSNNVTTPL